MPKKYHTADAESCVVIASDRLVTKCRAKHKTGSEWEVTDHQGYNLTPTPRNIWDIFCTWTGVTWGKDDTPLDIRTWMISINGIVVKNELTRKQLEIQKFSDLSKLKVLKESEVDVLLPLLKKLPKEMTKTIALEQARTTITFRHLGIYLDDDVANEGDMSSPLYKTIIEEINTAFSGLDLPFCNMEEENDTIWKV